MKKKKRKREEKGMKKKIKMTKIKEWEEEERRKLMIRDGFPFNFFPKNLCFFFSSRRNSTWRK